MLGIHIEYGMTVVGYDEDSELGTVTVERRDGSMGTAHADIMVAADGVGTKSHGHVTGKINHAESNGYAVLRRIIPMDTLKTSLDKIIQERFFSGSWPEFGVYLA